MIDKRAVSTNIEYIRLVRPPLSVIQKALFISVSPEHNTSILSIRYITISHSSYEGVGASPATWLFLRTCDPFHAENLLQEVSACVSFPGERARLDWLPGHGRLSDVH